MNYIKAWQTLPEYGLTYFIVKLKGSKKEVCVCVVYLIGKANVSIYLYIVIFGQKWSTVNQ